MREAGAWADGAVVQADACVPQASMQRQREAVRPVQQPDVKSFVALSLANTMLPAITLHLIVHSYKHLPLHHPGHTCLPITLRATAHSPSRRHSTPSLRPAPAFPIHYSGLPAWVTSMGTTCISLFYQPRCANSPPPTPRTFIKRSLLQPHAHHQHPSPKPRRRLQAARQSHPQPLPCA